MRMTDRHDPNWRDVQLEITLDKFAEFLSLKPNTFIFKEVYFILKSLQSNKLFTPEFSAITYI